MPEAGARRVDGAGAVGAGLGGEPQFHLQRRLLWSPNDGVVIDALGSPALAEELLAQIRRITPCR